MIFKLAAFNTAVNNYCIVPIQSQILFFFFQLSNTLRYLYTYSAEYFTTVLKPLTILAIYKAKQNPVFSVKIWCLCSQLEPWL